MNGLPMHTSRHSTVRRTAALDDFRNFLHNSKVRFEMRSEGMEEYFNPEDKLRDYLSPEWEFRTKRMIEDLSGSSSHDVWPNDIYPDRCKIFAIFVIIGQGSEFLKCAKTDDMIDTHLPFQHEPDGFPQRELGSSFGLFKEAQWRFCAIGVKPGFLHITGREKQLPLTACEPIPNGVGADSETFTVRIHPHYDRIHDEQHKAGAQVFALKVSKKPEMQVEAAKREVQAMFKISNSIVQKRLPIVHHFSWFYLRERFYTFQEYADRGTLKGLFDTEKSESLTPDGALKLSSSMMALLEGMDHIHRHVTDMREGDSQILYGWHQDIKPSNILVFSGGSGELEDYVFKLADFGLSKFVTTKPDINKAYPWLHRTYDPPQPRRGDVPGSPETRDIWALGCIFSQFAVWIEKGPTGFQNYEWKRRQELFQLTGLDNGWGFHDGTKQLDCLTSCHTELEEKPRFGSTVYIVRDIIRPMLFPSSMVANAGFYILTWNTLLEGELSKPLQSPAESRGAVLESSRPKPSKRQTWPDPDQFSDQPGDPGPATDAVKMPSRVRLFDDAVKAEKDGTYPRISEPRKEKLRNRDYVMLIDDGYSMRQHWTAMTKWLKFIIGWLYHLKADGDIDYNYFLRQQKDLVMTPKTYKSDIKSILKNIPPAEDDENPSPAQVLSKLLKTHSKRSGKNKLLGLAYDALRGNKHKPLSIFILTAASWDPEQTEKVIIKALETHPVLKTHEDSDPPFVCMQFIQFGDDDEARGKLGCLDHLHKHGAGADIVDTEPSKGCVIKMLCGPLDRDDDRKGEDPRVCSRNRQSLAIRSDVSQDGVLSNHSQSQH